MKRFFNWLENEPLLVQLVFLIPFAITAGLYILAIILLAVLGMYAYLACALAAPIVFVLSLYWKSDGTS